MSSTPVYLNELGVVCALGSGRAQVRDGLFADQPGGLSDNDTLIAGRTLAL
ncbi:MAG TPA: beta-ketoacyl-[acyl-carrier-protein] synthase II, partial [Stenotrophomonas sp.]|nr:beta-ketoacyl-[acyl-carrier-protein] synthase II [Stenotrophomonas sp.]